MMAIINILIYVGFACFASFLARKSDDYIIDNDMSPNSWDKYLIYFILFFAIIGGIRWNVGADSLSYARWFTYERMTSVTHDDKEQLWWWFVGAIQKYGFHWSVGLGLCALFQIFFITKTIQQYRYLLVFLPFVFFGCRYWIDCMNAVRQMIVGCGFLWASRFIYEKKLINYLVFVIIGSFIHQSALILIPFYFVPSSLQIAKNKWLLISVFLVCFILGQTPAFKSMAGYVSLIGEITNYDGYATSMSLMLLNGYADEALKFGPMMFSYLLIAVFIIWFGDELCDKYSESIPCINLWFNLSYFYACAYFLVCNLGHIFIRPIMYFSLIQMIMGTILLYHLWTEYVETKSRQITTILYCCIIALNTSWDVYKSSVIPWENKTYKVFFFNQDQAKKLGL